MQFFIFQQFFLSKTKPLFYLSIKILNSLFTLIFLKIIFEFCKIVNLNFYILYGLIYQFYSLGFVFRLRLWFWWLSISYGFQLENIFIICLAFIIILISVIMNLQVWPRRDFLHIKIKVISWIVSKALRWKSKHLIISLIKFFLNLMLQF